MPGILHQPIGRRRFLAQTAAGVITTAVVRLGHAQSDPGTSSALHLALLSDTHIPADRANEYRGFKPWENLERIVPEVVRAMPEGVIINGDAARLTGEAADYEALKNLMGPLARATPVYIGLGNHDNRDHFFQSVDPISGSPQDVSGKHVVVIEHPVVRIVILDSLLYVNKVAGLLGRAQREWLSSYLDETDDRPVVFFVHHTLGDGDGDLLDVDRLFRILEPHPKVKAIFYGHSHVYEYGERQGVKLINLPAVGYNFRDQDPVGWVDAKFHGKGVDLKLHAFGGNTEGDGKTTSVVWKV